MKARISPVPLAACLPLDLPVGVITVQLGSGAGH